MSAINKKLRSYRLACGFSQEAVAKEVGIKRTTLTAIENGDRKVLAEELLDFSRIYEVPVEELVNDGNESDTVTFVREFKKLSIEDKQDILDHIKNRNEIREVAF